MKVKTVDGGCSAQANAVARGLGWFSIGLGLAECLMPQTMARAVGLSGKEDFVRGLGFRGIATGVGILISKHPEPWLWARVAGDVLDLGALTLGLDRDNPYRRGSMIAMLAVAQIGAIDVACAGALAGERVRSIQTRRWIDYTGRSGFRSPVAQMRGAALSDFEMPDEFRIPALMRPWEGPRSGALIE